MNDADAREEVPLTQAAEYLLEECRMVIPGMQALFGFQLIAVFSERFERDLGGTEQRLHLLAIFLLAIAIALVLTPAAYHRHVGTQVVTGTFVSLSRRLLLWGMVTLALATCIDFYLLARLIVDSGVAAVAVAALFAAYVALWWVLPRAKRLTRALAGERREKPPRPD